MPRGNDPDAARELRERYGANTGNAEALIAANRARRDPVVRAAHLSARDDEASDALDLESIEAPGPVVDASVRGQYLTFVWEDETKRLHHGARPLKGETPPPVAEPSAETLAARRLTGIEPTPQPSGKRK